MAYRARERALLAADSPAFTPEEIGPFFWLHHFSFSLSSLCLQKGESWTHSASDAF